MTAHDVRAVIEPASHLVGMPPIFDPADAFEAVRQGDLEVRLARNEAEVAAAQRLRYRIFYEEMAAHPTADMAASSSDFDDFDRVCDHLLVIDLSTGAVVGTYRLIRRPAARRYGRFYSADEYDISPLLRIPARSWSSAAPASPRAIVRARRCSSCGVGSPPMSFVTGST